MNNKYLTWLEISRSALKHNIDGYKAVLGDIKLAPVIKSNAYGHGATTIAELLENNHAVDFLCTVSLSEALSLRSHGIKKPIIVLNIIDADPSLSLKNYIALPVYNDQIAHQLNNLGEKNNTPISVHIEIDTGLSRTGFTDKDAYAFAKSLVTYKFLHIHGIFTHFANSESSDPTFMRLQLERFKKILMNKELFSNNWPPLVHTTCSAAIIADTNNHGTLARAGIGMYGLWPSQENKQNAQKNYQSMTLEPVLSWKTRILQLRTIPAGSFVGYDLTYTTKRETLVATLPVGYWDGYDRGLSNKGEVVIHGKKAPIIGRIAMNLMMVDCTDIPTAAIGDEVLLLGAYPGLTADDIACRLDTINYEIVTRINPLLPRIIVD
jgi:alanine racemase